MTNFEMIINDKEFNIYAKETRIFCAIFKKRSNNAYCEYDCADCERESFKWLQQEYKSTLLKNGDGLTPGQNIEIYNTSLEQWVSKKFLTYHNGLFFCYSSDAEWSAVGWQYARLPEEGE